MKAINKRPGYTQQDLDADAILLRAYGKGTDVLIDRESMSTPCATIATPN
jgi:ethanolamine kinase